MGTAERKAREKLVRHQQILDAAYEVFNQVGFFAATMDQIAERAEIAKGTIYIYFKSKEEVYFSLLLNGQDILIGMLTDMKKRPLPPDQLLGEMAKTLFSLLQGTYELFSYLHGHATGGYAGKAVTRTLAANQRTGDHDPESPQQ